MAARGLPGAAMAGQRPGQGQEQGQGPGPGPGQEQEPQPEPGRCAYFVQRKRRFCRMVPAAGRRFCGEHGQEEVRDPSPAGGREGGLGPAPLWPHGAEGQRSVCGHRSGPCVRALPRPLCAGTAPAPQERCPCFGGYSFSIQSSSAFSSPFPRSG